MIRRKKLFRRRYLPLWPWRRIRKIVLFGFFGLAVCASLYIFVTRYFRIRNIKVIGGNISIKIDTFSLPSNLIVFPAHKLEAQLKSENPLLSDISVTKEFPDTLVIAVSVHRGSAIISTPERRFLVDSSGSLISDAPGDSTGVPVISVSSSAGPAAGYITDRAVLKSLEFIEKAVPVFGPVGITIDNESQIRARIGETDIIIAQDTDISNAVSTLQTLLPRFRMKGIEPATIDVRYDKPVVRE